MLSHKLDVYMRIYIPQKPTTLYLPKVSNPHSLCPADLFSNNYSYEPPTPIYIPNPTSSQSNLCLITVSCIPNSTSPTFFHRRPYEPLVYCLSSTTAILRISHEE